MNKALIILESNQLMRHLILFKLYIEGKGGSIQNVYVKESIKDIYGDDFDKNSYSRACKYLLNNGYTNRSATYLTHNGIIYFENWIKSFERLTDEENKVLNKSLSEPIFDFFKFTKGTTTVLSFVNQILKLSEKF